MVPFQPGADLCHRVCNAKPVDDLLVGLSASVGAGISMGFTEAAHDDGKLSGRGSPWKRGLASGIIDHARGLGHALAISFRFLDRYHDCPDRRLRRAWQ